MGKFLYFLEQIAPSWRHMSARIYAHVGGSRVDVVTLPDQMVRVTRFFCIFFTAMAGNKARNRIQGYYMQFNALN